MHRSIASRSHPPWPQVPHPPTLFRARFTVHCIVFDRGSWRHARRAPAWNGRVRMTPHEQTTAQHLPAVDPVTHAHKDMHMRPDGRPCDEADGHGLADGSELQSNSSEGRLRRPHERSRGPMPPMPPMPLALPCPPPVPPPVPPPPMPLSAIVPLATTEPPPSPRPGKRLSGARAAAAVGAAGSKRWRRGRGASGDSVAALQLAFRRPRCAARCQSPRCAARGQGQLSWRCSGSAEAVRRAVQQRRRCGTPAPP